MAQDSQFVLGIDENGLGPQLGPLVVSGALLEVAGSYNRQRLHALAVTVGIDDSKKTSAFGRMRHAESIVLALLDAHMGGAPASFDALLDLVALGGREHLLAPCPSSGGSRNACWEVELRLPAFGGSVAQGQEALQALACAGVAPSLLRSALVCPQRLNAGIESGRSKLSQNLACFEQLSLEARRAAKEDLVAYCGQVGGIRKYTNHFSIFPPDSIVSIDEQRGTCAYEVLNVGKLSFEVSADARHLPVALASMLGKYLRELWMARLMRFYRGHQSDLPNASGYHDPVSRRFVAQSEALRRRLKIADSCFLRSR